MPDFKNIREENCVNTGIILGRSLEDNVFMFKKAFRDDDTFITRFFTNWEQNNARFAVLYINGMVDENAVDNSIIKPIIESALPGDFNNDLDFILSRVIPSHMAKKAYVGDEMLESIIRGETVLLMDNCREAVIISTIGWESRGISEPENEKVLRGPREGFMESLYVNLSMLRRKLASPDLKIKILTLGKVTKTRVAVCYLDGIVNKKILAEVFARINNIDMDGVIASGYVAEMIKDSPYSPFKTIGSTERPDAVTGKLLEGHIAILVDGTPVAITMPFLFEEYFQTDEDYYINFYFTSIARILRILSFIITTTLPSIYIALLTFHQEMIPDPLLLGIAASRQAIPFPTIVETLGLLTVFEIFRESGIRMPSSIGQSVSILGALVLGTAAVDARIVSAPVIIVVALTGLTGLMTPRIKGPAIVLRFGLALLSGFIGLYGFVFGIMGTVIHLCGIRSFGVPYLVSYTSLRLEDMKDLAIRAPLWFMKKRPKFISGENKIRQASRSNRA